MAQFRILALDGGGIRGAFGVALMDYFEERLGEPVAEYFDLIAGTSTGAIIAASLAAGLPARSIVDFYNERGPEIFSPRPSLEPKGPIRFIYPLLRSFVNRRSNASFDDFFRARFCPHVLNDALESGFGGLTLNDVTKTRLMIPTVDLTNGRTFVFRTPHLPDYIDGTDTKIKDVLVAATAAPTYFPHKVVRDGTTHIDGGMFAVNPSMLALAEAMRIQRLCNRETCDPHFDTSEIHIVSIGTGIAKFSLEPPGADAGQLYWASRIADVMMSSQTHGIEAPLRFVLGDRYRRINFELPDKTWTLDAIQHIPQLFSIGRKLGEEAFDEVAGHCFAEKAVKYVPFESESSGREHGADHK